MHLLVQMGILVPAADVVTKRIPYTWKRPIVHIRRTLGDIAQRRCLKRPPVSFVLRLLVASQVGPCFPISAPIPKLWNLSSVNRA